MTSKRATALNDSQLKDYQEVIDNYQKDYDKIIQYKEKLVSRSAEALTKHRVLEYILSLAFFEDTSCTTPAFSLDQIVDYDDRELLDILLPYSENSNLFSHSNLKKLSVNHRIIDFIKNSQNAEGFFGVPGKDLTYNQVHLFEYSKYFLSLLSGIKDITPEEREDPDEIERLFILQQQKTPDSSKVREAFGKAKK